MGLMENHSIRLAGKHLCDLSEVSEKHGKEIFIDGPDGGTYLVLLRRGGQLFAYHNACPHQGRPMNWATDQFLINKQGLLVCAHHGASFEIESGLCVAGPCEGAELKPVALEVDDQRLDDPA